MTPTHPVPNIAIAAYSVRLSFKPLSTFERHPINIDSLFWIDRGWRHQFINLERQVGEEPGKFRV